MSDSVEISPLGGAGVLKLQSSGAKRPSRLPFAPYVSPKALNLPNEVSNWLTYKE